jgi:septum formation protein
VTPTRPVDLGGRRLVLASASPRRLDLLRSVGLEPEVVPADIDESVDPGEQPAGYVARLSAAKAAAVRDRLVADAVPTPWVVVAADTTVDVDGRILEKPADADDARRMLRMLSGRTHRVHTAVSAWYPVPGAREATTVVETAVTFVELTDALVDWYVSTGEPFGKAGGYAIQGAGAALVRRVDGSVTNVIGLPLAETLALLAATR